MKTKVMGLSHLSAQYFHRARKGIAGTDLLYPSLKRKTIAFDYYEEHQIGNTEFRCL